jgi:DNA polymerase I
MVDRGMATERVVLVDGTWLIFRAYYAIPTNFRTASGLPTNAIFGFANMFRKLLGGKAPEYCAMVFDAPGKTFRDDKFPAYKAQRPGMDDDLAVQLPWIDKVVRAHNVPIIRVKGYEADDVIGTLAKQAEEDGKEVIIVTADKDLAQLVSDKVRMMDTMRDVTYDAELVRKKWGVPPHQIRDFLALMGDKVDNIPGVAGIGQKGAATLLEKYGSVAGIYEHIDELKGRQKTALETQKEQAMLSLELATIDCYAPLPLGIDDLKTQLPQPEALNELYTELEFYSLLARDPREQTKAIKAGEYTVCATVAEVEAQLLSLGSELASVYPLFNYASAPPPAGGLAGFAVATAPGTAFYVPLMAPKAGLGREGLDALALWFEDPERPKVAHGGKDVIRELQRLGIGCEGIVGDTQLASFLVDPTKNIPHDLGRVAKEYLHRAIAKSAAVTGSGKKLKKFCELEPSKAADYACHLASAIFEIWPLLSEQLEACEQVDQLRDRELPLSYEIAQMELNGILVDPADLDRLGVEFRARLEEYERGIHELAGREFNIASTKQLSTVLFEELGLPVIKKTKTGYSTNAEVLEKLSAQGHEIAGLLLEQRKLAKLINTYTDVLSAAAWPETNRVHASLQQTTGATGRLISTDPDLQRTPVNTPEGQRIRQCFVAPPGHKLISADWSQIELRLLAHVTADPKLVEAFAKGLDVHKRTSAEIFGVGIEEVTGEMRKVGKLVNFATIYGQGATALGQTLGIPRKQAKAYIAQYFKAYAHVRTWLDQTIANSRETGYTHTLMGRRRLIPELYSKNPMTRGYGERVAANTPIQGGAADICKLVMLEIPRRFREAGLKTKMCLQIHDELVFEAPEGEVEAACEIIRDAMENLVPLEVPLVVDIGVGNNWDEAH